MENDANAGAVAEHRFGAGQGTRHMIFLTMGTGFGAGVIADGRLLSGASGQAGEIGHVRLSADGPVGYNKAGSVEGWVSGGGMAQVARWEVESAISKGGSSLLKPKLAANGAVTAKDVADAAQQGDELAGRIIRDTGGRLGEALAILVDLFNPERIVVGGLAMRMGEALLEPARRTMEREALPASAKICQVVPAALGERIGDVAAISVAMGL
jgi:glucokinase